MHPTPYIWMNGELVDWDAATVHIGTHGLHYGSGVFEGIRCYETPDGPAVFRLTDHVRRLDASARLIGLDLPFAVDELARATLDLVAANELPSCYIRPIAFLGYGTLGVRPQANPVEVGIMAWPWGAFLGEDAAERGIRAKVSSWRRVGPNTIPHAAKATGVYVNSLLDPARRPSSAPTCRSRTRSSSAARRSRSRPYARSTTWSWETPARRREPCSVRAAARSPAATRGSSIGSSACPAGQGNPSIVWPGTRSEVYP